MHYRYGARSKNGGGGTKDVGGIICPLVEIGLNYLPNMHGLAVFIKEHS